MMKFGKYLLLLLIALIMSCGTQRFIDWTKTFDSDDTIPMGTFVLRKELHKIFPKSKITNIKTSTLNFFRKENPENQQYFFINQYTSILPNKTWEEILYFVNNGGTAFVSSYNFDNYAFADSLKVRTMQVSSTAGSYPNFKYSVLRNGNEKSYLFDSQSKSNVLFSDFDTETTEILGYSKVGEELIPNFIIVYYGKGYFLLHTEPVVFSNYEMLQKDHYKYVTDVFSYMNDHNILWDNYDLIQRNRERTKENTERSDFFNSLNFIMRNKSLKNSFFILLILGILYLIFNSKRRQRIQEIIVPYSNYTLNFSKTLAELYRYSDDHTALTRYKINYFLDQLRTVYNLTPKDTEKDFTEQLSAKSGVSVENCRQLVAVIMEYRNRNYLNKHEFLKIQSLIESFNRKTKF